MRGNQYFFLKFFNRTPHKKSPKSPNLNPHSLKNSIFVPHFSKMSKFFPEFFKIKSNKRENNHAKKEKKYINQPYFFSVISRDFYPAKDTRKKKMKIFVESLVLHLN